MKRFNHLGLSLSMFSLHPKNLMKEILLPFVAIALNVIGSQKIVDFTNVKN